MRGAKCELRTGMMGPTKEDATVEEEASDNLKLGDHVMLIGLADNSGLNGTKGTLMKVMGKDRWVVKVENAEKTKILTTKNLRKVGGPPPVAYSIIATCDEWEPHQMVWNEAENCYEAIVKMGKSCEEDFKFLEDGEWSKCVYPNREKASPWDNHTVQGPNEDDADTEWTIGRHPNDRSFDGAIYTVRLFLSAEYKPLRVDWELQKDGQNKIIHQNEKVKHDEHGGQNEITDQNDKVKHDEHNAHTEQKDTGPALKDAGNGVQLQPLECKHDECTKKEQEKDRGQFLENTMHDARTMRKQPQDNNSPIEEGSKTWSWGGQEDQHCLNEQKNDDAAWAWDITGGLAWKPKEPEMEPESDPYLRDKKQELEVMEVERKARERLEKHLEEAAQQERIAIKDKEEEERQNQELFEEDRKIREEMANRAFLHQAQVRDWGNRQFQGMRGKPSHCMECWKPFETMPKSVRTTCDNPRKPMRCCEQCYLQYQRICKAGWNATVVAEDGYTAAEHALWTSETKNMPLSAARQLVMHEFRNKFMKGAVA